MNNQREIKFRVWDTLTKKMVCEGFHVIGEVTVFGLIDQYARENKGDRTSLLMRYNDFVIQEWTGLQDSDGKDIYEGDITELINEDGKSVCFVVKFGIARRTMDTGWEVDIPSFYFDSIDRDFKAFPIVKNYCGKHDLQIMKVVGNIYERPFLANEMRQKNETAKI